MSLRRLLRDPLAHFLIAGALVFAAVSALSPPSADDKRITIDRAALLEFVQFRSKAFEPATAAALLDSLDAKARAQLIADFVEEEALHREALALGLDAGDYVLRQRLVEKFRFLAAASAPVSAPDEAALQAFYESQKDRYRLPASATFVHVFFDAEKRGADAAEHEAIAAAERLNAGNAESEEGKNLGDRFPFQPSYTERTRAAIAAEFGDAAADAIFATETGRWIAPITSIYGAHAVYVERRESERLPRLQEIEERVLEDFQREKRDAAAAKLIAETVADYRIEIAPDLKETM